MCAFFQVSGSGYYAFVHRLGRPEKDAALAEQSALYLPMTRDLYGNIVAYKTGAEQ